MNILTEEELKEWFEEPRHLPNTVSDYRIKRLIIAYRSLLSANAELSNTVVKQNSTNLKLVFENDELLAETMMRIKYEGFLRSVIRCKGTLEDSEDYEWFKQRHSEIKKSLEESK